MAQRARVGDFEVFPRRVLGEGQFGRVYQAVQVASQAACAAKQMRMVPMVGMETEPSSWEEIQQEVQMLQTAGGHPNVLAMLGCQLVEAHEDAVLANSAYLFMELCTGGMLLDKMIDGGPMPEDHIRPYARCLIEALAHCHARGVVHRDVKLDNIMLSAEDPGLAKLCDFGLAEYVSDGQLIRNDDGTPGYRAPEMHLFRDTGFAGPPCDCFAVAVTIFALAAAGFPWEEAWAEDPCFAYVQAGQAAGHGTCALVTAHFNAGGACPLSTEMQDLLDALFRCDPASRETMARCAAHPWVTAAPQTMALDGEGPTYRDLGDSDRLEEDSSAPRGPAISGLKKIAPKKAMRRKKGEKKEA